ncbi:TetR/AcrR family transcriptional regulator [Cobetia sp. 1CM21F]|uniref:TetR/AcrR family transcriptional regulator n=1 Tax=Cobetia sp. 1CM21F TaxID=2929163 RepID=UPI0020C0DBB9|nr:TetR/AcrR family transcriptional regulator [Cobetia sp. 1CM21F]MCK8067690.1 TetR/AcrR family transcriptional regulator [Cobetia sp. 1CM21F]
MNFFLPLGKIYGDLLTLNGKKMASGRRREFDEDIALRNAMEVFWLKGYAGASLSDLTQSMGINKTSMYSAFGNKSALFVKATKHYIETEMLSHLKILQEAGVPLKKRLKNYMLSVVSMQCASEQPKGCFLVLCQSEIVTGGIPEDAAELLKKEDEMATQMFTNLFSRDPEAISLGLDKHAQTNALTIYTILKGTASMARSGVPASELHQVVDNALRGIGIN